MNRKAQLFQAFDGQTSLSAPPSASLLNAKDPLHQSRTLAPTQFPFCFAKSFPHFVAQFIMRMKHAILNSPRAYRYTELAGVGFGKRQTVEDFSGMLHASASRCFSICMTATTRKLPAFSQTIVSSKLFSRQNPSWQRQEPPLPLPLGCIGCSCCIQKATYMTPRAHNPSWSEASRARMHKALSTALYTTTLLYPSCNLRSHTTADSLTILDWGSWAIWKVPHILPDQDFRQLIGSFCLSTPCMLWVVLFKKALHLSIQQFCSMKMNGLPYAYFAYMWFQALRPLWYYPNPWK